jgi:type IV pilus assembly protein PilW
MNTLRPAAQRGMTLIELMVSVALALLVTLVALGVLLFSRQSGSAMEQATALRDNARFATELVRRIALQAGFESPTENTQTRQSFITGGAGDNSLFADIGGVNNALVVAGTDPQAAAQGNRSTACGTVTDTRCVNGSDVLILRYQGTADGSMINCAGVAVGDAIVANDRPMSAFHVRLSASGEPTLTCTYRQADGSFADVELIEGVESFQVLFGVDGVTPGMVTTATGAPTLVTRYLRADQMVVPGQLAETQKNWRRVRAIRIGMILRGPPGSAATNIARDVYPLGEKLFNADDAFSKLTTPADGRLRQELTFTVHLRNYQGLEGG